MLTYILRRMLLMIPTLFGITIMVFGIARCAPGRPGASAFGGGGDQMSAEGQKQLREWYEKRYGLDLPLHMQYVRWWKGMFFEDRQASSWTANGERIFTLRQESDELYARDDDGQWYLVSDLEPAGSPVSESDAAALDAIASANQRDHLLGVADGYPVPLHLPVQASMQPIESLDMTLLEPAGLEQPITVDAHVWTQFGQRLYVSPEDDSQFVYIRNGRWFSLEPNNPDSSTWSKFLQDDPSFKPKIDKTMYRSLPEVVDGRPTPLHLMVSGKPTALDEGVAWDPDELDELFVPGQTTAMAWMWTQDGHPVFKADEPVKIKLFKSKSTGEWQRLVGASRIVDPEFDRYEQGDAAFTGLLSETQIAELPTPSEEEPELYHVVMKGDSEPFPTAFDESRDVQRYQHSVSVFSVTLGTSLTTHVTVMQELKDRLPVTLGINLLAFPIIYVIAIPTGMLMALKRGLGFDRSANIVLLGLWSVPTVLSATLFIGYLGEGGAGLEWFPNNGLKSNDYDSLSALGQIRDRLWHLVLPVTCIVYGGFAYLAKQMRAAMLENFTMDYVRTARAKGVSKANIVIRHVMRNSLLPLITIFATILPAMIAGSVIIEQIFNIEGMGQFTFQAIQNRDYDVVQSMAMIAGLLTLSGLLVADICYALVDPRITYK